MQPLKISHFVKKLFETNSEFSEWFGYYNYDTLNYNQTKMLCNRSVFDRVAITKDKTIELGYYDVLSGIWNHIGYSDSFNWPQGAMLQWLPGKGNENKVIYNCSKDDHLISRIYDIEKKCTRDIDYSIYGLMPDGEKSISLNFERSYWCRAYHYQSVVNQKYNVNIAEDDGVFEVDLKNNTRRRIIAIQDVINVDADRDFDRATHWLEHIMISPNGTRFCFLHRFTYSDIYKYETRLCIANTDGSDLQIIKGWRNFRWSHFGWNGDNEFTIYSYPVLNRMTSYMKFKKSSKGENLFSVKMVLLKLIHIIPPVIKRKIRGRSYYQYYKLSNERFELSNRLNNKLFVIDGHPSFTNDKRYMITDSYPYENGYQKLIVFDMQTQKGVIVAQFYAPLKGNPASCDLHPKLCRDNRYLVVDTAYDRKHHMIMFELNWDKIKEKISI